MHASIPAQAGDGNGDIETKFGQALLEGARLGAGGRAALLLVGGVPAELVAKAAAGILRRADVAGPVAADRFAVFAPHLRETGGAADLAARILTAMPRELAGTVAVGIALAPEDADDWPGLFAAAETALARAGDYRTGRFAFVDAEHDARLRIGPLLAGAIAEALAEDQFALAFQPIVALADGRPVGAEALIRWPRPGGEAWPPAVFIPEAENRGLIEPITAWTLRAAFWRLAADPRPDFAMGVNLSAAMLGLGAADMVAGVLRETGAAPDRAMIEITETSSFIDDADAVADAVRIAELGCRIAIDDFGAGRASLAYAVKLPASRIKLDASLSRAVLTDDRARAAIRATVGLAEELDADVVAEGVLSSEIAAALHDLGVDHGQGGHFGAPSETF